MEHWTLHESLMFVGGACCLFFAWLIWKSKLSRSYSGKRYGIDWKFIFILSLATLSAWLPGELVGPWGILAICAVVISWVVYIIKKGTKAFKQGEIDDGCLYNLKVNIHCSKRNFEKMLLHSAEDEIELYGMAINKAKSLLAGDWHVIKGGYLIKGFVQGAKSLTAEVDVDDVYPGIYLLEKIVLGRKQFKDNSCRVHMHFKENGWIANVGFNEKGLYLY